MSNHVGSALKEYQTIYAYHAVLQDKIVSPLSSMSFFVFWIYKQPDAPNQHDSGLWELIEYA